MLTATPAGIDVVDVPVGVDVIVDVDVALGAVEGVEEAAVPVVPVLELADAVEDESEDDELDGSARAIPWLVNSITPVPSATARPPIRATYAALRTQQL